MEAGTKTLSLHVHALNLDLILHNRNNQWGPATQ